MPHRNSPLLLHGLCGLKNRDICSTEPWAWRGALFLAQGHNCRHIFVSKVDLSLILTTARKPGARPELAHTHTHTPHRQSSPQGLSLTGWRGSLSLCRKRCCPPGRDSECDLEMSSTLETLSVTSLTRLGGNFKNLVDNGINSRCKKF